MNTVTLNEMWDTRPPRIPSSQGGNAKIAGVCEGIGARYQIDPTLVRVAFVVTALVLGGGIALYALAWMCMPRYGKASAPIQDLFGKADGPKSESSLAIGMLVLFVATAGVGPFFGDQQTVSTVVIFVLAAAAWYGLHRRQPVPPAGLLATAHETAPGPDMSVFTPVEGYPFPPGRQTPPAWDPLGTVPEAWDLPDPAPRPEPAPAKKRAWFGPVLVVAGAVALGTVLLSGVASDDDARIGNVVVAPRDGTELLDHYSTSVGNLTVNLGDLQLDEPRTVTIETSVGNTDIYLPHNVSYSIECSTGLGDSNCTPRNDPDATLKLIINTEIGNTTIYS